MDIQMDGWMDYNSFSVGCVTSSNQIESVFDIKQLCMYKQLYFVFSCL